MSRELKNGNMAQRLLKRRSHGVWEQFFHNLLHKGQDETTVNSTPTKRSRWGRCWTADRTML